MIFDQQNTAYEWVVDRYCEGMRAPTKSTTAGKPRRGRNATRIAQAAVEDAVVSAAPAAATASQADTGGSRVAALPTGGTGGGAVDRAAALAGGRRWTWWSWSSCNAWATCWILRRPPARGYQAPRAVTECGDGPRAPGLLRAPRHSYAEGLRDGICVDRRSRCHGLLVQVWHEPHLLLRAR